MAVRRLIISDLHFVSGDDLLSSAAPLDRIEPEPGWADEVVNTCCLLALVVASLEQSVGAAGPFLRPLTPLQRPWGRDRGAGTPQARVAGAQGKGGVLGTDPPSRPHSATLS